MGEDGRVYVIDVQQNLLTKATHIAQEHHLSTLTFIHADLEAERGSTLEDASVDAVLISNLLFQAQHKAAILSEAYRILRPSGMLLIVDWRESFGGMGPQPEHVLPEDDARAKNRALVEEHGRYVEVYISTPLAVCKARDVKGLYEKAEQGLISGFTGVDDPYEVPDAADVVLDTSMLSVEECVERILQAVESPVA